LSFGLCGVENEGKAKMWPDIALFKPHNRLNRLLSDVSRARRSTKPSEVVRRRPGINIDAEPGTIPDQRCTAARCTASGNKFSNFSRHGNTSSIMYGVRARNTAF
jgi:hypothetical protein